MRLHVISGSELGVGKQQFRHQRHANAVVELVLAAIALCLLNPAAESEGAAVVLLEHRTQGLNVNRGYYDTSIADEKI